MVMFDHEKLDVYRVALEFAAWAYRLCKQLSGIDRPARDQLLQASQSIVYNIAEGNGKRSGPDRRRYFEIARGSALECAANLDTLAACEVRLPSEIIPGKELLVRVVAMLTKMTAVADQVREQDGIYEAVDYEYDYEHEHEEKYER